MIKSTITTLAVTLTCAANPVQALPVWAKTYAKSHCEYLAMGATWRQAAKQAFADNDHWSDEMKVARANNLLGSTLATATQNTCPDLEAAAYSKHKGSNNTL